MFVNIEEEAESRKCQNGHSILFGTLTWQKYCDICGALLETEKTKEKHLQCSKCKGYVNSSWKYCIWCGEKG